MGARRIRHGMRDRVAVKALTPTEDDRGGQSEDYSTTTATVWAKVSQESGSEGEGGQQVHHTGRYMVTIRYRSDVDPTSRITWGSRTLRITGIRDPDDGRKRFLELTCEEVPST